MITLLGTREFHATPRCSPAPASPTTPPSLLALPPSPPSAWSATLPVLRAQIFTTGAH